MKACVKTARGASPQKAESGAGAGAGGHQISSALGTGRAGRETRSVGVSVTRSLVAREWSLSGWPGAGLAPLSRPVSTMAPGSGYGCFSDTQKRAPWKGRSVRYVSRLASTCALLLGWKGVIQFGEANRRPPGRPAPASACCPVRRNVMLCFAFLAHLLMGARRCCKAACRVMPLTTPARRRLVLQSGPAECGTLAWRSCFSLRAPLLDRVASGSRIRRMTRRHG